MSSNNIEEPKGILSISDPTIPPELNEVKNRCLILSPTVKAGLEPESRITDFVKEKEIGKCKNGKIWKVIHKKTQKIYCLKEIQKQKIIEEKLLSQINREIEIMYLLNNPHCLRLKNHFEDDDNFYLLTPLAIKGSIYKVLKKFKKFDEKTTAQILRETISAVQYLHNFHPPIIHRDIKPENLLLNSGGRIMLSSFRFSNFIKEGEKRKTICGTPEYISPEMLSKNGYDTGVDIWSIGILLFELLCGYSPFFEEDSKDIYKNIKNLEIKWPKDISPLAKDLITKILKKNPLERPNLEEILNHQWFKKNKIIKPLLENEMKTTKDLLIFHMLNECTNETLDKINQLLIMSGMDSNNSNNKNIIGKSEEPKIMKESNNKTISSGNVTKTPQNNNSQKIDYNDLIQQLNEEKVKNKTLDEEMQTLKNKYNEKTDEVNNLKEKIQSLQTEITNIQKEKNGFNQLNPNNINEIKELKETIMKKDKEIKELKETKEKVCMNDIIVINFLSEDQNINCGIPCLPDDIFVEVEEKFYKKFEKFRDTNNKLLFKGNQILRFKKVKENNIQDGDTIQLITSQ